MEIVPDAAGRFALRSVGTGYWRTTAPLLTSRYAWVLSMRAAARFRTHAEAAIVAGAYVEGRDLSAELAVPAPPPHEILYGQTARPPAPRGQPCLPASPAGRPAGSPLAEEEDSE